MLKLFSANLISRRFIARIGWIGILGVAILSLVPGDFRPHTLLPGPLEHSLAYALTGVALAIGYPTLRARITWWLALTIAAGIFECLQAFIPDRSPALIDAAFSSGGAAIGLLAGAIAGFLLDRLFGARKRTTSEAAQTLSDRSEAA